MKSKRRHELQENVLAQELGKIAEFFKVHGNHLATAALIVAILILGYVLLNRRAETKKLHLQQEWGRALTGNLKPDERVAALTELTKQTDSPRIAALAGVELACDYARQLLTAKDNSQRSALADKAFQWYQDTIQRFPKEELAVAKAHYGLGKLKEAAGQFQQAGEEYRLAKESKSLTHQPVVQLADIALLRLKDLETAKVRMAATMPAMPATSPATKPATKPAEPGKAAPATEPAPSAKTPTTQAKAPAAPPTPASKPAGKAGK